jgi:hypothetical protein
MKTKKRSYILDPYEDRFIELYRKGANTTSISNIIRSESNLKFVNRTMHRFIQERLKEETKMESGRLGQCTSF